MPSLPEAAATAAAGQRLTVMIMSVTVDPILAYAGDAVLETPPKTVNPNEATVRD